MPIRSPLIAAAAVAIAGMSPDGPLVFHAQAQEDGRLDTRIIQPNLSGKVETPTREQLPDDYFEKQKFPDSTFSGDEKKFPDGYFEREKFPDSTFSGQKSKP